MSSGISRLGSAPVWRALVVALGLLVIQPDAGLAQAKSYKRFYLGLGGALLVGVPAYAFTGERSIKAACSSKQCIGLVAGMIGGAVGFLIGSEMDKSYERRMAAGPTLDYKFRDVRLDLVPDRITPFPGGAAVAGVGGARVVFRDGTVSPRGSGVRGIEDVAVLPSLNLLVLSTFSNLIGFPVADDSAQGQVIDERGGGTMELFQNRLAVASLDSVRLLRLSRDDDDVLVETLAGFETTEFVTDMAFSGYGRVGWVLMEDRLVAYGADLRRIGEIVLPAAGRTVRARGSRLAVAAGTNGVFILDARDPAAPQVVQHYTGVRFAYAADLDGDRLYVAAGPEGVAVVDIAAERPKVLGVARRARFATDVVVAASGEVWILDRDGRSVQIAEFGLGGDAQSSGGSR
jgi:hypothetical protein